MKGVYLFMIVIAVACSAPSPQSSSLMDSEASLEERAAWLEKAAASLRHGEGLGAEDDVEALLAMTQEDVINKLMDDPRFGDTMLAFNLFYLGRSVESLKSPVSTGLYRYDAMAFAMPQALASARTVVNGGDYFKIYSADPGFFVDGLTAPYGYAGDGSVLTGTDAEKRVKIRDVTLMFLDQTLQAFGDEGDAQALDKQAGCQVFQTKAYALASQLTAAGFPASLELAVYKNWIVPIINAGTSGDCNNDSVSAEVLRQKIQLIREAYVQIFAQAETLASLQQQGGVRHIGELGQLEMSGDGLAPLASPLTVEGFWTPLRNSSTNFNRKRAAYMLRTYFCDDLTPISVEVMQPSDGGNPESAHASNPDCQACHYKLDPMAGLFRNYGAVGQDFSLQAQLSFDDGKLITGPELEAYVSTWKGQADDWKVGYFVGAGKPHRRWKGNTLEDIWNFLPQAPEVKQCLVRRMAEYFLGPEQAYDGAWLDELSKNIKPGPESSLAVKDFVKELLLSKTFVTQDPEPGKCYDFADGDEAGLDEGSDVERAPCEIDSIVKRRCANCHSDVGDFSVEFIQWPWPHQDANGNALSKSASLKIILDRLTTADPLKRMPKGGAMPEMERQILYKWLDKQLNSN